MNMHHGIDGNLDYGPDFSGFINYMIHENKISDMQKQDLIEAKKVLQNGMNHSFKEYDNQPYDLFSRSRKHKIISTGDRRDAISIENAKIGIDITRKINDLIINDQNFNRKKIYKEPRTNFYILARAQSCTDMASGLQRLERRDAKNNKGRVENVAFGYGHCPEVGWYYEELPLFNKIKSDLGVEDIFKLDGLKKIRKEALRRKEEIGHYVSLFNSKNTINAVGYNQYGNYGNTAVYLAIDQDFNNRCSYSFDEMSEMLDRYLENIV